MPLNFMSFPREIRDRVYEAALSSRSETICPFFHGFVSTQTFTPGLLQASKTVHAEACSLLYSHNRFDFSPSQAQYNSWFLEMIGPKNAACIRQILIDFPQFRRLGADSFKLDDDSIGILKVIQKACTGLATLTTSLHSSHTAELWLDRLDSPSRVTAALALVDSYFVAMPSLQKTIIEVYEDNPNDSIRRQMENHGWTLQRFKRPIVDHKLLDSNLERFNDPPTHDDKRAADRMHALSLAAPPQTDNFVHNSWCLQ